MNPLLFSAFTLCLGLIIGSFLSLLIPRLHHEEKGILTGRSHCFSCKHVLAPSELIPLFSFLLQGGKCKHCHKTIPLWYPLIEFSTAATFFLLSFTTGSPQEWLMNALLFTVLLYIFFYDLRYKEIHDAVMLPAILLALLIALIQGDPVSKLVGAAVGFAFFGIQYLASQGRWLGSGDLRIGVFIGLMLGWQLTLVSLVISYVVGSVISMGLLISGKATRKTAIPLGPFLVIGTVAAYFFGAKILSEYFFYVL